MRTQLNGRWAQGQREVLLPVQTQPTLTLRPIQNRAELDAVAAVHLPIFVHGGKSARPPHATRELAQSPHGAVVHNREVADRPRVRVAAAVPQQLSLVKGMGPLVAPATIAAGRRDTHDSENCSKRRAMSRVSCG